MIDPEKAVREIRELVADESYSCEAVIHKLRGWLTPSVPITACGAVWPTDYGPAYCDKGADHTGDHRCYGSKGPITWHLVKDPIEAGFLRAVAESIAADALATCAICGGTGFVENRFGEEVVPCQCKS